MSLFLSDMDTVVFDLQFLEAIPRGDEVMFDDEEESTIYTVPGWEGLYTSCVMRQEADGTETLLGAIASEKAIPTAEKCAIELLDWLAGFSYLLVKERKCWKH